MRCEVLAIGTELLLGQIVDTNSAWIGEQLAGVGHRLLRAPRDRRQPGAHRRRAARHALAQRRGAHLRRHRPHAGRPDPRRHRRGDGCAAGPAHGAGRAHRHDVPRAAAATCRRTTCGRPTCPKAPSRCRTRSVPRRALLPGRHRQGRVRGAGRARTRCRRWCATQVIPDLLRRSGEVVGDRVAVVEDVGDVGVGAGGDGRAPPRRARRGRQRDDRVPRARDRGSRRARHREGRRRRTRSARARRRRRSGSCARFSAISCSASTTRRWSTRCSRGCADRGWTLGVAESLTGGLIGGRIANVPGASDTFRGTIGVVRDRREAHRARRDRRVGRERGRGGTQMAEGARRVLGADVGIAVTGVAGPTEQDGVAVGTVLLRDRAPDGTVEAVSDAPSRRPGTRAAVLHDLVAEPVAPATRRARRRRDPADGGSGRHRLHAISTRWSTSLRRRSATNPKVAAGEQYATVTATGGRPQARVPESARGEGRGTGCTSTSSSGPISKPRRRGSRRSAPLGSSGSGSTACNWLVMHDRRRHAICDLPTRRATRDASLWATSRRTSCSTPVAAPVSSTVDLRRSASSAARTADEHGRSSSATTSTSTSPNAPRRRRTSTRSVRLNHAERARRLRGASGCASCRGCTAHGWSGEPAPARSTRRRGAVPAISSDARDSARTSVTLVQSGASRRDRRPRCSPAVGRRAG